MGQVGIAMSPAVLEAPAAVQATVPELTTYAALLGAAGIGLWA